MARAPISLTPSQTVRAHRLGLGFLADFLETAVRHHPRNVEALAELGHVYTRLGRFVEGLEVDRQLVDLVPTNPTVHYNLACSLALGGEADLALASLEEAIRLGYGDGEFMSRDEDLRTLWGDSRFEALVQRLQPSSAQEG